MEIQESKKLVREIINKDKWWDILSRFIDVLRLNIFIIDTQGQIVLPPDSEKYGGQLLIDPSLGYDLPQGAPSFIEAFNPFGRFLEYVGRYGLYNYAIPIQIADELIVAYMVVGPVILNQRWDRVKYNDWANEHGVNLSQLMGEINEIRVVTSVMVNSILELLHEIVRDNVAYVLREREFQKQNGDLRPVPMATSTKVRKASEEIYATVRIDELLVTLLDVALRMTNAENGSVMLLEEDKKYLSIKVSRGLDEGQIKKGRVKIGEGIAGLAAKEKRPFLINGQEADKRLKNRLKRPDIRESLVMPLLVRDHMLGVLNIHTKSDSGHIRENIDNLKHLVRLVSSAF